MNLTEKKIGSILIVVEKTSPHKAKLNSTLSEYADCIISRQGLNLKERNYNLISLIVEGDINRFNSFAGKIGRLKKVKIKMLIAKQ